MNEIEFTEKHLGEYKLKGNEINVKYCPFCNSPKRHNQYKFFINMDKHTYICHRGSCNAKGTFNQLTKIYGEKAGYVVDMEKNRFQNTNFKKKSYDKPKMDLGELSEQALKYITLRGFSEKTIRHFKLKSDKNGNIVFPYYDEKNVHRLNKIRIPRKFDKNRDKTKIWQEGAGKPILFNMNNIDINKPLIITEGEWDCMAVYECGYENVVSIPFGTSNVEWINECWDFLEKCNTLVLWYDNDSAGSTAVEEVVRKVGIHKTKIVSNDTNYKDANDIMHNLGKSKVVELVDKAEYIPVDEIIALSDCVKKEREKILYGNKFLDYFLGACAMGELVIWTGKRGGGKSTILNQTLIDTVDQKYKVFIYSGELNNYKVKQWLDRQIAGVRYIETEVDLMTGREDYIVHPQVEKIISEWYRDYIYTYSDTATNDEDCLFEVMEYAYKRHNVKRFVLDNLKTVKFKNENDFYRSQGLFVSRCKAFARQYEVHIDLVVHPRKTQNMDLDDEDVGGSVDIIDLADNIVTVGRITPAMLEKASDEELIKMQDKQTVLSIKKNREYGDTGVKAFYKFEPKSKRIYGEGVASKVYSWEKQVEDRNFVLDKQFKKTMVEVNEDICPF